DPAVAVRPLLFSILLGALLFALLLALLRDRVKSALLTALGLVVFFSFGHLYSFLENHRTTAQVGPGILTSLASGGVLAVGAFAILRGKINSAAGIYQALNLASLALLIYPVYSIAAYQFELRSFQSVEVAGERPPGAAYPDIYYIVLDGYSRQDTLAALGFDNGPFVDDLEDMGFYVASCSRSNYKWTLLSLSSTLNMDYVWDFIPNTDPKHTDLTPLFESLHDNRVMRELRGRGYKTYAFDTGYEWVNLKGADSYLESEESRPSLTSSIQPFEYLFLETTILRSAVEQGNWGLERFRDHYERVLFTLETLPGLASEPGPKFVYAHIVAPHTPYVFLPDGSFRSTTEELELIDIAAETDEPAGYLDNVRFINDRIPAILQRLIEDSPLPPIIILQGDHGFVISERRYNILNAYYLPGGGEEQLYPKITPVNSFRLVFGEYFGMELPLLKDLSIRADLGSPYRRQTIGPFPKECP
ncbi:MAG: sulfatase-like hydrolase/transferase, partial [Chloroflexota bacterium]